MTRLRVIEGGSLGEGQGLPSLTEGQQAALANAERLSRTAPIVALGGAVGSGKTLVMRALAARPGRVLVGIDDMLGAIRAHPGGYRDVPLFDYLLARLERCDMLLADGLHAFASLLGSERALFRRHMLLDYLYRSVEAAGKRLILTGPLPGESNTVEDLYGRDDIPLVAMPAYGPQEYAHIARATMGEAADGIAFAQVHRNAALLNGYALTVAARTIAKGEPSTRAFIEATERVAIHANTRTAEVEPLAFDSLPGSEHLARALDTHVVLPLTDPELSDRFNLRPKRGVLLYGPPGTGKTSVGRALAHRLKGRFFLIDGSVKTEPFWEFMPKFKAIAEAAAEAAPSVLFIDDADVLFGIGHAAGLGRYLLSLLDGLASQGSANMCVMMTAMDASKIPAAILRSGRVELWLETRLPDEATRARILARWIDRRLPGADAVDAARLAVQTAGFTPADLRRVTADAMTLYGADQAYGRAEQSAADYLARAVDSVIETRRQMARNLADPTLRVA